jgi:hypothetical protein
MIVLLAGTAFCKRAFGRVRKRAREIQLKAQPENETSGSGSSDGNLVSERTSAPAADLSKRSCRAGPNLVSAATSPFRPPATIPITNAATLLDVAQIGEGQVVIRHGVFACVLQTMLLDGGTHLIALTR